MLDSHSRSPLEPVTVTSGSADILVVPAGRDAGLQKPLARGKRLIHMMGLGLTIFSLAEVTARVQDYLRYDVSPLVSPDRDADLVLQDERGVRGRPNGRFKHWKLNAFGFRGPDISKEPPSDCVRVMTLGASETFGLYESPDNEYPARLGAALEKSGCYEVINASLYGLNLPAIRQYWNLWLSAFRPAIVTIYPTPAFYLTPSAPAAPPAVASTPKRRPWWTLRLIDRAFDVIEVPAPVQAFRVARAVSAIEASHPPEWFFREVPVERLRQFEHDLDSLVRDVKTTAASVILLTHATGFTSQDTEQTQPSLMAWRQIVVRPTAQVLLAFEDEARQITQAIARRHGAALVDVAASLNGQRAAFAGDRLHFSDEGADRVAQMIASVIRDTRLPLPVTPTIDARSSGRP